MTARVHIETCLECEEPGPGPTLLCQRCAPDYEPAEAGEEKEE